ncbi:MAG: hypothetical protein WDZ88_03680 [Candidatus Paceibacterota bacterium]
MSHPHIQQIGGIHITSLNPEVLSEWYKNTLGVSVSKDGEGYIIRFPYDDIHSKNELFSFVKIVQGEGSGKGAMMPAFRVNSVKQFTEQCRANDCTVVTEEETDAGKFLTIEDAESNRLVLWEDTTLLTKQKRTRRKTAKKLEVMFEFLLFGLVFGIVEDILAVWLVTGEPITLKIVWLVVLIAIPFAIIGELVADNIDFSSFIEKMLSKMPHKRNTKHVTKP